MKWKEKKRKGSKYIIITTIGGELSEEFKLQYCSYKSEGCGQLHQLNDLECTYIKKKKGKK